MFDRTFTAIVVGSGFAGAVTACRLAQAGVNVCLLERGRRYEARDFPEVPHAQRRNSAPDKRSTEGYEPPRDFARWLWSVDQGLWDIRDLGEMISIQAAGYGGGSLVYANVHLRAPEEVFTEGHWPPSYNRKELDPYYDLAAFMLDVQPFPPTAPTLAKTARLREAAGGGNAGDQNWFLPPLAINFDKPRGKNRWGKEQGNCNMSGFCCLGCGEQAKNTLDLNYLAIAEQGKEGRPAKIITLAEVEKIERSGDENEQHPFTVTYYDHLLLDRYQLSAQYVFLCAGALSTTELLLANQAWVFPDAAPPASQYFGNGDSLAVVFDCKDAHEVDRGPTITSSLLYKTEQEWFLVQDGGVPEELDAVLGVFRSPLWLYRNRYLERDPSTEAARLDAIETDTPSTKRIARPKNARRSLDIAATHFRSYRSIGSSGAREIFAMLPPHSAEPVRGINSVSWPPWLKQALADRRELFFEQVATAVEPLAQRMLDHLATLLEPRLRDLGALFPAGKKLLQDAADLGIARGFLSLGAQLLWGSESDGIRQALRFLVRTPKDLNEVVKLFVPLLKWSADYRPRDGRTAVLLTMGRDFPRTLERIGEKELRATSDDPRLWELRKAQEFALRDIGRTWGGELRTNPTWAFGHRQLTVHGQGGAPMRASRKDSVTDEWGEVFRCRGLFVMDAAAFPSAVGVNPSATIAAIAERKVEHFIRERWGKKDWRAPEWSEAKGWAAKNEAMLDPLPRVKARVLEPPKSKPFGVIGLRFQEWVDGHFSKIATDETVGQMRNDIENNSAWEKLQKWVRDFEDAEIRGLRRRDNDPASKEAVRSPGEMLERGFIELSVTATVKDLTAFLEDHYAGRPGTPAPIELEGHVVIAPAAPPAPPEDALKAAGKENGEHKIRCPVKAGSTLKLFPPTGSKQIKLLEYEIQFDFEGVPHTLHGLKIIKDDPRLDLWQDTATLFFGIATGGREIRHGVVRLSAKTFLKKQLESFEVLGTTDDERRMWALAAFATFFITQLADSYLPELRRIPAILKNMLTRTHG